MPFRSVSQLEIAANRLDYLCRNDNSQTVTREFLVEPVTARSNFNRAFTGHSSTIVANMDAGSSIIRLRGLFLISRIVQLRKPSSGGSGVNFQTLHYCNQDSLPCRGGNKHKGIHLTVNALYEMEIPENNELSYTRGDPILRSFNHARSINLPHFKSCRRFH